VLGYEYWRNRLASDPQVINRRVLVNGHPMVVVGIADSRFKGVQVGRVPSLFIPITMKPQVTPNWNGLDDHSSSWVHIMGRLKPGLTREQAQAQVQVTYRQGLEQEVAHFSSPPRPATREKFLGKPLLLDPGARGRNVLQRQNNEAFVVLIALAAMVLLICAFNLANLQVARGAMRARQYAIRTALGATRWTIVRQVMVETLLLFAGGAIAALLVAQWLSGLLVSSMSMQEIEGISADLNGRALLFNFVVALAAGILAALFPALRVQRQEIVTSLKDLGSSTSSSTAAVRLRRALIVAEVAVAVLLLTAAGLFAKTLSNLRHVDLGREVEHIVSFTIEPGLNGYDPQRTAALLTRIRESLVQQPGVSSVSLASIAAFNDDSASSNYSFEGYRPVEDENTHLSQNWIAPDYFLTFGMRIVRGREFNQADIEGTKKVAIISESAAQRFFPGRDPIGAHIAIGAGDVKLDTEIVGIVKDARHATVRAAPEMSVYVPYTQYDRLSTATFYVRSALPFANLASALQNTVREADASLPVNDVMPLDRAIDVSLAAEQLLRDLSSAFAAVAALLAAVGIYALLAFAVVVRTREIGIRLALGAQRRSLMRMILGEGLGLIGAGIVVGIPIALLSARALKAVLFGVSTVDVTVLLATVLALGLAGLLASYLPARRATTVEPLVALRYE
jgi:putative ABC transport system permease protein